MWLGAVVPAMTKCIPDRLGPQGPHSPLPTTSSMAALASTKIDVTVARALIESEGRVLLVRRARWDTLPGRWELPGGKVDRGEPLLEALAREVEEETGLMLAAARRLSTREMLSPRGRTVREHVYAVDRDRRGHALARARRVTRGSRRPASCGSRTRPRPRSAWRPELLDRLRRPALARLGPLGLRDPLRVLAPVREGERVEARPRSSPVSTASSSGGSSTSRGASSRSSSISTSSPCTTPACLRIAFVSPSTDCPP